MSKYTPEELREMAAFTINAFNADDPRAELLIVMMAPRTGLAPSQVQARIETIAAGGSAE